MTFKDLKLNFKSINISYPYAKAAFNYSLNNNCLEHWKEMFSFSSQIFNDSYIQNLFFNSIYSHKNMASILLLILDNKVDRFFKNFIRLIGINNRILIINSIFKEFMILYYKYNNILNVTLISCISLNNNELNIIKQKLENKLSKKINILNIIDKSILGGIILQFNDTVFDFSVRNNLRLLSDFLQC